MAPAALPAGRWWRAGLAAALLPLAAAAAPPAGGPLPQPLTLAAALARLDAPHPALEAARAARDTAAAELMAARVPMRPGLALEWSPRTVKPAAGSDRRQVDDSFTRLSLNQRLYDFGATAAARRAAGARLAARRAGLLDARQRRYLDIMGAFFDVLLADLRYEVDNQDMAYRYVRFDHGRERARLGALSPVDLKALEHRYQQALLRRTEAEKRQLSTRLRLALLLDRPGEPPADLVAPELPGNDRPPPEFEALWKAVAAAHPHLDALRRQVAAARAALDAARARRRPVLSAALEFSDYARDIRSRNTAVAGLRLHVPLYQGGAVRAAVAAARARLRSREAALKGAEYTLRQAVLDLVQRIETLQVQRRAARVRLDYREMNLDRARAVYDLEQRSTLGDAMTRLSEAQWQAARVEYALALAWAELEALRGRLLANEGEAKP